MKITLLKNKKLTQVNTNKKIQINESDLSKITNGSNVKHSQFGESISISGRRQ